MNYGKRSIWEIRFESKPNTNYQAYTSIVYEITDSKEDIEDYKLNPLDYPQTIIDIAIGILRIYKSPRINYVVNYVNYSPGCPKFMETENPHLLLATSFTNDYLIKID